MSARSVNGKLYKKAGVDKDSSCIYFAIAYNCKYGGYLRVIKGAGSRF